MTTVKGYSVVRVELEGKSIDDVIEEVQGKVAEKAAVDVQSLYTK